MTEIERRVCLAIAEILNLEAGDLRREQRLREDLGADDLDRLEIVMTLEQAFNLDIPDDPIESFATVGDVVTCLERLAARAGE